MFERFTERARKVVFHAQKEAKQLKHNIVGTEHLLLGLIQEGEGVAGRALEELGISLEKVREEVIKIIGVGDQSYLGRCLYPRAKRVLELAVDEARQLGHNYVGTEHILLGLIREGEGVAAQVLKNMGADMETARKQVMRMLGGGSRPDSRKARWRRGQQDPNPEPVRAGPD